MNIKKRSPSQSAMEYLMTYGWAILVVAVILAVLFELGLFSQAPYGINVCIPTVSYVCTPPALAGNGLLSLNIGQAAFATMTVTGIACTNNSAAPQSFTSVSVAIPQDTNASFQVQCPISNFIVGQVFTGYVWLQYNTPFATGQVASVATIEALVQSVGVTTTTNSMMGGCAKNTICFDDAANSPTNTLTISTSNANEVILIAADGGDGGTYSAEVDGNTATAAGVELLDSFNNNKIEFFYYTAPSAGVHTVSVSYGVESTRQTYAIAFTGANTASITGDTCIGHSSQCNDALPLTASFTSTFGKALVFAVGTISDTSCPPANPITWSGSPVTPTSISSGCQSLTHSGDAYLVTTGAGTYNAGAEQSGGSLGSTDLAGIIVQPVYTPPSGPQFFTTAIYTANDADSNPFASSLSFQSGYTLYICASGSSYYWGGPPVITSTTYTQDVADSNTLTVIGHESSGNCGITGYDELTQSGIALYDEPAYTMTTATDEYGMNGNVLVSYTVSNPNSFVVLAGACWTGCDSLTLPEGCTQRQFETTPDTYSTSFIATCQSQTPSTYSINVFENGNYAQNGVGGASVAAYVFPNYHPTGS